MSPVLLILVSMAYVWTGIEQGFKLNGYWAGFWCSYAAANLFYLCAMKGT
jgi:hypothetical protein